MGLEILEKKFQHYLKKNPENIPKLKIFAKKASRVQKNMRTLLDRITSVTCKKCEASCCRCMPVEGWFTESDYFIFRILYDAPFDLQVLHGIKTGCAYLGPNGCVLPQDLRPFPCVKVNCNGVTKELEANGSLLEFNRLSDELSKLQKQIWPMLKN